MSGVVNFFLIEGQPFISPLDSLPYAGSSKRLLQVSIDLPNCLWDYFILDKSLVSINTSY